MTLVEFAVLCGEKGRIRVPAAELLPSISPDNGFRVLPIDLEIATEIAALGESSLNQIDRTIVATARIHRLRLITSDQRIIESGLVPTIS